MTILEEDVPCQDTVTLLVQFWDWLIGDLQILAIKMNWNKQKIIEKAYSFYPKGISFELDNELYRNTNEYQLLSKALEESCILNSLLSKFIRQLSKANIIFQEIGPGISLQRSFQLAFITDNEEPTYLVLCISKITPFYCFYSLSSLAFNLDKTSYTFTKKFKTSDLNNMQILKSLLSTSFSGYQLISPEYLNYELQNVEYEDIGQLNREIPPILYKKMTIFTALFSTFIYY